MNKIERNYKITSVLANIKTRVAALRRTEIESWSDYPHVPAFDLGVGSEEFRSYTFVLIKDTLPDGSIRIAIVCYLPRFWGMMTHTWVDGFVLAANGSISELTQEDKWDVT